MKKTFITTLALVCLTLGAYTAKAQKSFIELNAGYSMYTMDYKVGGTTLSDDINVFNVNLGYSYNIAGDFYFGGTLGYTDLSGDKDDNGVSLYTLTPKLTYFMALGSKMYWTPNVYVTFGYGKTDLGTVAGVDLGDINKLNVRIGLSPLSLDFRLSNSFSLNVTALTPYYNILRYSYSKNSNTNFTQKDFVYLGGQIGLKLYF